MHKLRTHHKHTEGRFFSYIALLFTFGVGLTLPIFPNFVQSILETNTNVSIFFAVLAVAMFMAALSSTILFTKVQRTTILKISLLISAIVYFILPLAGEVFDLSILSTIRAWVYLLIIMSLSLFVRDFANEDNLAEEEGRFYMFDNIGYLLGPLIGGFIGSKLSYEINFIAAGAIMFIGLFIFYHQHIVLKHPSIINRKKTTPTKFRKDIKEFFSDPNRKIVYLITLILMCFHKFKYVYIPLFVISSGYLESMTGLVLGLCIVPLILLEVKVGNYADKNGIRYPISAGFLILALSLLFIFLNPYTLLDFTAFVIGYIGFAFIEPLQEYFLFKHLPRSKEENLYGVYMTADPIAYFITPTLGFIILYFLPFNYLFLAFSIILFSASILSFVKLKHS